MKKKSLRSTVPCTICVNLGIKKDLTRRRKGAEKRVLFDNCAFLLAFSSIFNEKSIRDTPRLLISYYIFASLRLCVMKFKIKYTHMVSGTILLFIFLCLLSSCYNPWMADILGKQKKPTPAVTYPTTPTDPDFGGATIHGTFNVPFLANVDGSMEWLDALEVIAEGGPDKNYIINLLADITVSGSTAATFTPTNIAVSLRGGHKLTLSGQGSLLRTAAGQTVILRGPSLQGISGNDTSLVYVDGGTVTMHGGKISGNTTNATNHSGVYVGIGATFDMYGGEISGNTANGYTNGSGGVYVGIGATFTMHSGAISGNTSTCTAGGVFVYQGATFTMLGGTISGNKATGTVSPQGGGVFVASGTVRIVNGTIYGNTEADESLRNTAVTITGAALYKGDSGKAEHGRFDGTGGAWNPVGGLITTDSTIKVVNGVLIKLPATTAEDAADFDGNAPDGTFTVSSQADWDAAIEKIKNGGPGKNYVITVTGNVDVPVGTPTFGTETGITVSLRGNGTLALDETSTGGMIRARTGQTVILRDLTLKGHGTNTSALVVASVANSAIVMHSGTITGNTNTNTISGSGGGVSVLSSGTFTMHGGTITGNTNTNNGGGVSVSASGTFTMHGGTISGNKADNQGGGVYVNLATFRLVTGTIYGNEAAVNATLRNNAPTGAALYASTSGTTAERGTFSGETWTPGETLTTRNDTIQ